MNQILDILSSFLIGGIILLAIIGLNMQFTSKFHEMKLAEITLSSSSNIGQIIENDFKKIGYGNQVDTSIVSINRNSITFKADLDNNGTIENVRYSLVTNNNEKFIKRIINFNENNSWTQPINSFEIFGLTKNYDTTYNINNISSILVNLEHSRKDLYGDKLSVGVQWQIVFYPKNLTNN